jgi:ElaB/YqjD/DUF883 family membrane-anchored ribosome-binding protein
VVHQATLKSDLGELKELHAKLGRLRPSQTAVSAGPARKDEAPAATQAGTPALLRSFAGKTAAELGKEIDIEIEDNAAALLAGERRDMLRELLEMEGYDCVFLPDGDELLRLTAEYEPDLILLAADLPSMSGLELVGDLRGLLASRDLDGIPEIKQLRQRLDDGIQTVRDATVRAAQQAADQARDAARAADRYAHDEPWRVASAALAVGALVGFLLARR